MRNQMQEAFARIQNLPPMFKSVLARIERNRKPARPYESKLSFRTYNKLKAAGIVE